MRNSGGTGKIYPRVNWVLGFTAMLLVVVAWVILTEGGIVKPLYLPGPRDIIRAISDVAEELPIHIFVTLIRTLVGYGLGVSLGIGVGLLMGYSKVTKASLHGIIEAWRPIPPIALIPFFLLWFGFSFFGRILLVTLGVALIMVVATYEAMQNVPAQLSEAAKTLGARRQQVLWTVQWPAIRPELRGSLRVSLALSISLVIASEFLGAQTGLGYLINVSKVTFSTHVILLAVILLGIISGSLDYLLRCLLKRLTPWCAISEQS